MRPAEVDVLLGDATKAREQARLGAERQLEEMLAEMVEADLARHRARQRALDGSAMAPRRILVTGAAGFVGLASAARAAGEFPGSRDRADGARPEPGSGGST